MQSTESSEAGGIRFVTANPLKLQEAQAIAVELVDYDCGLREIQAIDVVDVVREKAKALQEMHLPFRALVEDTGLEVPSCGSLPGALVKWFLAAVGANGLAEMMLRGMDRVAADAISAVAAVDGEDIFVAVGRVEGWLVQPRGREFGWNSVFQPSGHDRTFAEMSDEERLHLSMRRAPITEAVSWIRQRQNPNQER